MLLLQRIPYSLPVLVALLLCAAPQSRACIFEAGDKVFDLSALYNPAGYTMMSNGYQYRFDICNSCDEQCRVGTFATCGNKVLPPSRHSHTICISCLIASSAALCTLPNAELLFFRRRGTSTHGPATAKPWAT